MMLTDSYGRLQTQGKTVFKYRAQMSMETMKHKSVKWGMVLSRLKLHFRATDSETTSRILNVRKMRSENKKLESEKESIHYGQSVCYYT